MTTGKTLTVTAAPGLKVPREDNARKYIMDTTPVKVPASAYYIRRITQGELVDATAKSVKKGA